MENGYCSNVTEMMENTQDTIRKENENGNGARNNLEQEVIEMVLAVKWNQYSKMDPKILS